MIKRDDQAKSNRVLLGKLFTIALVMFGFGYAMVPFYKKICATAGFAELASADEVKNTQVDPARWLTVQFDANTRGLPWEFEPVQKQVQVHPGQLVQVAYRVTNNSDSALVGQAIPAYGPHYAASYVRKLECFCFARQELQAHEVREMPVQFVIDANLPKDVNVITLSYTFFEVPGNPSLRKTVKG